MSVYQFPELLPVRAPNVLPTIHAPFSSDLGEAAMMLGWATTKVLTTTPICPIGLNLCYHQRTPPGTIRMVHPLACSGNPFGIANDPPNCAFSFCVRAKPPYVVDEPHRGHWYHRRLRLVTLLHDLDLPLLNHPTVVRS